MNICKWNNSPSWLWLLVPCLSTAHVSNSQMLTSPSRDVLCLWRTRREDHSLSHGWLLYHLPPSAQSARSGFSPVPWKPSQTKPLPTRSDKPGGRMRREPIGSIAKWRHTPVPLGHVTRRARRRVTTASASPDRRVVGNESRERSARGSLRNVGHDV